MTDPIQNNLTRPQRYWYVDGLAEITGGSVILLIGLVYTLGGLLPAGLPRAILIGPGQMVVILAVAWLSRRVVRSWKERLTYPRTGYVEYRHPTGSKRWSRIFLLAFVAFSVSALTAFLARGLPERIIPALTGLTLALAVGYLGTRIGLTRFYVVAGFSLLMGAAISWLNPLDPWSAALIFSLEGLAWIVSGLVTLRHYLRTTRPLSAEEFDE